MNDVEPPYNSHKLPRILTSSYIRIPHLAENKSECVQTQDPENFQDGGGARKTMIPYPEFLLVNFADVTVSTHREVIRLVDLFLEPSICQR